MEVSFFIPGSANVTEKKPDNERWTRHGGCFQSQATVCQDLYAGPLLNLRRQGLKYEIRRTKGERPILPGRLATDCAETKMKPSSMKKK